MNHINDLVPSLSLLRALAACCCSCRQVLAFIIGRGVLVLPLSLPQFTAVMLAPFMPAQMMAGQPPQQQPLAAAAADGQAAHAVEALPAKSRKPSAAVGWQQVTPLQRYSIDVRPSSSPQPLAESAAALAAITQQATRLSRTSAAAPSSTPFHQQWQRTANLLLNVAVTAAFIGYTCSSRQRFLASALHLGSLGVMWRAMELLMFAASVPARDWLGGSRSTLACLSTLQRHAVRAVSKELYCCQQPRRQVAAGALQCHCRGLPSPARVQHDAAAGQSAGACINNFHLQPSTIKDGVSSACCRAATPASPTRAQA